MQEIKWRNSERRGLAKSGQVMRVTPLMYFTIYTPV